MLKRMQDPQVSCVQGASQEFLTPLRWHNDCASLGGPLANMASSATIPWPVPSTPNLPIERKAEHDPIPQPDDSREPGNPRRPLIVAHVVEGCQGGVGTAVKHLIEEQKRDPQIGAIHLVADPDRLGEMLSNVPASSHWYKSSRAAHKIIHTSRCIDGKLREIEPDVVYLHSTFSGIYGRLGRGAKKSWATVYCPHGWAFSQSVSLPKRLAYAAAERMLAPRADAIVSVSRHEEQEAIRYGVRHTQHRVIRHGIPANRKAVTPAIVPDENCINLLFIGRFDRQKGLDLLLDAWADPRLSNVHLWLIGDATLGGGIKIPRLPNVHMLGWIKHDEIDSYIQSFDAIIVPSRWEALGLVALEAMRNGRAVIASRIGGLQELVIDSVNGVLFESGDRDAMVNAVARLDKQRLAKMGQMARDVFDAGFEWSSCYEQWKRLTEDVVVRGSRQIPLMPEIGTARLLGSLAKRSIDVTASCAAIIALLPLWLLVAMAIKVTSRGPILFGHKRCGRDGRMFRVWKFRTMVLDADKILQAYLSKNPEAMKEWKDDFKLRKDPRITVLGKFLRRYSLDELPQLLNVLTGSMSLVGPRPIVQMEVERYAEAYDLYTRVKPGITGLWQVSGRNDTTYAERIQFDLFYIRNWSIWLDLSIIWKTFYVVFAARGSY
jgi:lipopolysaccharide/colanic/teichoic acid biosynthesis glycosyltransferase/glycosyltransferase involved in cell wall biosynthesis